MNNERLFVRDIDSPVGVMTLIASDKGLRKVLWDKDTRYSREGVHASANVHLDDCEDQLSEYFEGTLKEFELTLDLVGTEFQCRVWNALAEIEYGKTRTYKEQATLLGDVKAIRAVASANGRNPISLVLPCHRVIGSDGSLTGFAGGLDKKRWLLEHERSHSDAAGQISLF